MSSSPMIGRYRLEAQTGAGRFSTAYRALDTVAKRLVTLQVIDAEHFSDRQALQRFLQRSQGAADLVHPRLAWVWEAGEAEGLFYVAERFVQGSTLKQRLVEGGPLTWNEANRAIEQLAQGLDFAHERGWVHGAVRPENIYLSLELGAVLAGFGAPERVLNAVPGDAAEATSSEAQPAADAERYLAPEAWRGAALTPAVDRYALACVLAEMLSGQPLFDGATTAQVRRQHLAGPILPYDWPPGTPWQIEPVLERALDQDPAQRFDAAIELAQAADKSSRLVREGDAVEHARRLEGRQQRREAAEQARRQAEEAARLTALEQARRELDEPAPDMTLDSESAALARGAVENGSAQPAVGAEPGERSLPGAAPTASSTAALPDGAGFSSAAVAAAGDTLSAGSPILAGAGAAWESQQLAGRASRRRATSAAASARRRRPWIGLIGLALAAAALWLAWGNGWLGGLVQATPTATTAATATTAPPATAQPATRTQTFTATLTPSPSATVTLQPTATATRRPTATRTRPTPSASPSATATAPPRTIPTVEPVEPRDRGVP